MARTLPKLPDPINPLLTLPFPLLSPPLLFINRKVPYHSLSLPSFPSPSLPVETRTQRSFPADIKKITRRHAAVTILYGQ